MELNRSESFRQILLGFLMLILPWIVIVAGLAAEITNPWYFILSIVWFGSGVIFFQELV